MGRMVNAPSIPLLAALALLVPLLVAPSGAGQGIPGRADLVVDDITWTPPLIVDGDPVTFHATIENDGGTATGAFRVRFLIDGESLGERTVPSLDGGGAATVSSDTWTASGYGSHTILVIADANDDVHEIDEDNNARSEPVQVTAPPPESDLAVLGLTWSPDAPGPGDEVTFEATIRNRGQATAQNFRVTFSIDGTDVGEATVSALGSQQETTVESDPWTATRGNHTVRVAVDAGRRVTEANETNNDLERTLPVLPDLAVSSFQKAVPDADAGDKVTFVARIKNVGTAPTHETGLGSLGQSSTFRVRFLLGSAALGGRDIARLDPGQEVTVVSDEWTATVGAHTVRVIADALGDVDESSESNNEASQRVVIGADLIVAAIHVDPAAAGHGDEVTIRATVQNVGTEPAGAFHVRFAVDGHQPLGDLRVAGLGAGATATVTSNAWTASEGDHALRVEADALGVVDEVDEANNAFPDVLRIGPPPGPPDLVVMEIATDPATARRGQDVTLSAVIRNQGATDAGAFAVRFEVNGATVATADVAGLEAGARVTVSSTPWTAASGPNDVRVTVDPFADVAEEREDNNQRVTTFDVSAGAPGPALVGLVLATVGGALWIRRRRT